MTSDPFYLDPTTQYNALSRPPLYTKFSDQVLGLAVVEEPKPRFSACFNCGSDNHNLRSCPKPRDHKAISQARDAFMEAKASRSSDSSPAKRERFFEAEARSEQQVNFLDRFIPGVVSRELREAAGMEHSDDFEWLHRFCEFGYPPGYERAEDAESPYESMARRIKGVADKKAWQAIEVMQLEESADLKDEEMVPVQDEKTVPVDSPHLSPQPAVAVNKSRKRVRYAVYNCSLFDSDRLPVCFPGVLPTLAEQARAEDSDMDMSD